MSSTGAGTVAGGGALAHPQPLKALGVAGGMIFRLILPKELKIILRGSQRKH